MKIRLVILTEIIAPYRIPVFNALAQLDEIDLQVVFLAENDPALRQWLVYKDEIHFSYQILPNWRMGVGRHRFLLNRGMSSVLKGLAPDVIVCGGYNYVASWQAWFWARRNRVAFLLWVESTARDIRSHHALIEFGKRRFMRGCDAFIVPGTSSLEYLRTYGEPERKIFIAPNAVDIELFCRLSETARKDETTQRRALQLPSRFFLYVGRLVPEKGVFDLLRSYGTLAPNLRAKVGLVFVGDGVARSELERRAVTIIPGSILVTGFKQRDQLPTYYGLADAFVFPTHTDTWGLVVNEAMASGLPVISTEAAGCAADLVTDHWNGRVVLTGDIYRLSSAMQDLASDDHSRALMSLRSRERILKYSPAAWASGIARAVFSVGVLRHD
jgi:1,2-diacylglycerol 3-alpha-glucosyltransferase